MQSVANAITSDKPWVLVLGRKRQVIKQPMRLEHTYNVSVIEYDDGGQDMRIASSTLRLFIDNKLFSTSIVAPRKRYSRFSLKVIEPKRKRLEIHLTKKLTKLAS